MPQNMSREEAAKKNSESIHSGQFMVSHFEAEETQEGTSARHCLSMIFLKGYQYLMFVFAIYFLDDEDELEMPEESDDNATAVAKPATTLLYKTNLTQALVPSTSHQCMELQILPDPRKAVTQVEIDSDLSQVFNTLNVTYK